MKNQKITTLVVGLLLLFLISNCKKQDSPSPVGSNPKTENPTIPPNPYTPPAVTFSATVLGFVVDENNNPVQNAVVSTGTKTFTTDANGAFEFSAAPFTGDFCYIKAIKKGYFSASTTLQGAAGNKFTTRLVMTSQTNIQIFNSTEAKTISIGNNASVGFPADAIKTLDGKPYTGNVNVATIHLDPTAKNFGELIPGGDLRAYSSEGKDVMLFSYGMVGVELRDDAGNHLQLADGKKATLNLDVPAAMKANAPATISLWYFDDNKGVWIEEGDAKLQNGVYVGIVSHFTYWNCDVPGPRAKLKGKLKDCEGKPEPSTLALTGQTHATPDREGNWERFVPIGIQFDVDAYDRVEDETLSLKVPVPVLADNQVYDIGLITVPCRAKVKGTITDCDNNPFTGYLLVKTSVGTLRDFIINGDLYIPIPKKYQGLAADVFFYNAAIGQLTKISITLPVAKTLLDIGNVKACPATTIPLAFSFDYVDGGVTKMVNFNNLISGKATFYSLSKELLIEFSNDEIVAGDSLFGYSSIIIKNPKTGSHSIDSLGVFKSKAPNLFYINSTSSINVTLDKYDGVGGQVSGTFTGSLYLEDRVTKTNSKQVNVSNGKFSALRLPDE